MERSLFVMDRGFVLAVLWEQDPNDFLGLKIHKAYVVRRWGTSNGLGELAEKGKLAETILDQEDCTWINKSFVHRRIKCNDANWEKLL